MLCILFNILFNRKNPKKLFDLVLYSFTSAESFIFCSLLLKYLIKAFKL